MASCRYHVGTAAASSTSGAATTTTPPTAVRGPPHIGLYLPGGGLSESPGGSVSTGLGGCHNDNVILSASQQQPEGAAVFTSSPYLSRPPGLVAASAGGLQRYSRGDMTQLMTLPHPSPPQHNHSHHHYHTPSSNVVTSGPTPHRDPSSSAPAVVVVAPVVSNPEYRKSKRSGCKSTYKHVPHREKAPHLVARRNARERRRVQAVNTAFVRLRRHVPHENRHKRLSKVKTLHFAIDYINYMQRMINEYDAAVQRAGGGRVAAGGGAAAGMMAGLGAEHGSCRLQGGTVDMVELNSTKENRWMPVNLPPPHGGDPTRGLYLTPDGYGQYHQEHLRL